MVNRLKSENSPYLLQHKDNPVEWYPWGEEALDKARKEDKPIFLSVGYAACHWCHVMAHESFEDAETAAIMNEYFINIKVDREERPDIDGVYMTAVIAMSGQGGWPMSVFLAPDGKPFYGGTYYPPVRRYNMPSFKELLLGIVNTWKDDRPGITDSSEKLTEVLQKPDNQIPLNKTLEQETLNIGAKNLAEQYDWDRGGWGQAPKFPQPMSIQFLLRRATKGDKSGLDIATHALTTMARGGMYDVVGGGFARYSVDDQWLVPHFEKMLYDNAQLARNYLHAYLLTRNESYRRICEQTFDFLIREMTDEAGGFFSSLDADSEGEEGKFYVWSIDEIQRVIKMKEDQDFLITAYDITKDGNFEKHNVLQRVLDDEEMGKMFNLNQKEVISKFDKLHANLLEERGKRIRPDTDDKVLTAWNGLALVAFAEAGRYLKNERYIQVAKKNAFFLLSQLKSGNRLLRSWRQGKAKHNAYLEDYAALILGLLALYQSDPDPKWYEAAIEFGQEIIDHFVDPDGGFFDTRKDHEKLIIRPKDLQDNATPSGNALAATALLELSAYTGKGGWYDVGTKILGGLQESMGAYPSAFGQWLCAMSFALGSVQEIAIIGDSSSKSTQKLIDKTWEIWRPNSVVAVANHPPPKGSPDLLKERPLINNKPTAYVCQNFVCKTPVTTAKELGKQLDLISSQKSKIND